MLNFGKYIPKEEKGDWRIFGTLLSKVRMKVNAPPGTPLIAGTFSQ